MADPAGPSAHDTDQSAGGPSEQGGSSRTGSRATLSIVLIAVVFLGSIACMCAFIFALVAV